MERVIFGWLIPNSRQQLFTDILTESVNNTENATSVPHSQADFSVKNTLE